MKFSSNVNKDSLFDQLKSKLYDCKLEEIGRAKRALAGGELEEALDEIESDYIFNLFKLDEVAELESSSVEQQRKFVEMCLYIDSMDMRVKPKTQATLTSACILNKIDTRTQDLENSQFFLLAATMVPIPLDEYRLYGDVLSNPALLSSVSSKTDDINEQIDMMDSVLDYCDSFVYEGMSDIDYKKAISDSINLIQKHPLKQKESTQK